MASTKDSHSQVHQRFDWRAAGLLYYGYNFHLRQLFGYRVQRVSIDAGFTCPNVDGTVATGGCTFCDNRSFSPSRRLPKGTIHGQIDEGIRRLKTRYKCKHFMAYFQPASNTYAPVERLRKFSRRRSLTRKWLPWPLGRALIASPMMSWICCRNWLKICI